jgi:hypothetical protein
MKTRKIEFLMMVSFLALTVMACQKDPVSVNQDREADALQLAALSKDTAVSVVPDIVLDDSVLLDNATVSQYSEDFLSYTYDRSGRLAYINYIKRNTIQPVTSTDLTPRYIYMRDKFSYGNAGRLIQLIRFNVTSNSNAERISVTKNYKYNKSGQLYEIITRRPNAPVAWEQTEFLYYDNLGNMVEKLIREPFTRPYKFIYSYDKENRLIRIAGYRYESARLHFICELFYDNMNNIERRVFYYPYPWATSVNDVVRKWVANYKYDSRYNPFKDFKLPVSSLFEWMDVISPDNITAISFNNEPVFRAVYYKYRYNSLDYPVLRYRLNLLPMGE